MNEEYCFTTTPEPTTTPDRGQQNTFQVDAIIERVKRTTPQRFTDDVSVQEIHQLCNAVVDVLRKQPTLVEIQPPVIVVGDIHGQFKDLLRIFEALGFPPDKQYLFLGDYVDRGPQSLETMVLLFCYKVKYPANFMLLRGNHECANINRVYGFLTEIERRYGRMHSQSLYDRFNQTFAWLPFVGLIGKKILCMHGGISGRITSLQQLGDLRRPSTEPPNPSLEIDLLWADPQAGIRGVRPSERGASVLFGEDVVHNLCQMLNLTMIIRAHQVVQNGTELFAGGKLITLFSAPRYANRYNNTGAALTIAPDLRYTTSTFPPMA